MKKIRLNNIAEHKEKRRLLRNNLTPAEAVMWRILKGDKIMGIRWRRQFSVGPYILDFYCPFLKLAIELDAYNHYTDSGYQHDSERDCYLSKLGIEVMRFENTQEQLRRQQHCRQKHRSTSYKKENQAKGFHFENANFGS